MPTPAQTHRATRIRAESRRWHPVFRRDCVDFVAAVKVMFFSSPLFDAAVFSDDAIARLAASPEWRRTRSIAEAITRAKAGDFVIAALTSAQLGSQHGHLAIVVGIDGEISGSVIVPIGYAGSIGGAAIHEARLTGTFRATLVRAEQVDYYIATPEFEPAAEPLDILRHAEWLASRGLARPAPTIAANGTSITVPRMAWGTKVSPAFRVKVHAMAARLGLEVDHLMAVMAFETGETFDPAIRNPLSGATGLIQFMPATARRLGTSTDALASMSAEEQLDWVERYFATWRGRLGTLADTYMAVLWPRAIGKPDDYALFKEPSTAYRQNRGLDRNKDGAVTKHEAAWKVQRALDRGFDPAQFR